MAFSMHERLDEFLRRLEAAPALANPDDAMALAWRLLDEVEDEMSGIQKQHPPPRPSASDGRMYPPQPDHLERRPDGSIVANTRRHQLRFATDGAVSVVEVRSNTIVFAKPGG